MLRAGRDTALTTAATASPAQSVVTAVEEEVEGEAARKEVNDDRNRHEFVRSSSMPRPGVGNDGVWSDVLAIAPGTVRQAVARMQRAQAAAEAAATPQSSTGTGRKKLSSRLVRIDGRVRSGSVKQLATATATASGVHVTTPASYKRSVSATLPDKTAVGDTAVVVAAPAVDALAVAGAHESVGRAPAATQKMEDAKASLPNAAKVAAGEERLRGVVGAARSSEVRVPVGLSSPRAAVDVSAAPHLGLQQQEAKERDRRRVDLMMESLKKAQELSGNSRRV